MRGSIESAPDAIVVVDGGGVIVFVNARAEALFGYAAAELVGERVEVLAPLSARAGHVEQRAVYAADPSVRPMGVERALSARCKDGRELAVGVKLNPVLMNGSLLVAASVRASAAREQPGGAAATGAAVDVAESGGPGIFERAAVGMALVAHDGRLVRVNGALCELVGYREVELDGLRFGQLCILRMSVRSGC